jgi:hypothetical protein
VRQRLRVVWLSLFVLAASLPLAAQTPPAAPAAAPASQALRIFLDCDFCDTEFLRTEITFVDYVRDRQDADVHLMATIQGTGGGGIEWTVKFIGQGRFAGQDATHKYVSASTDTSDEQRRGLARVLKMGLMPYVAGTPLAEHVTITFTPPEAQTAAARTTDAWNYWVFSTSVGGSFNGEESSTGKSVRGSLSANRTTEGWRISFSANSSYRDNSFDLGDGTTFKSISRGYNGSGTVVKSLTPHWSLGLLGRVEGSTFLNYDMRARIAPGVEYNFFPYSESTRRMLTVQYTAGYNALDYREETIFSRTTERVADQQLDVSLSLRQPWGSAGASVSAQYYLNDRRNNRFDVFGNVSVRVLKGLSFNVFGQVSRPRDQFYLPKGEASTEEILVRQRQLATNYSYFMNFNVSYRFGSIFNNIVNPRFGGGGGIFFF